MSEHDFNAHYRCTYCHVVRSKSETIFHRGEPFCSTACMEKEHPHAHRLTTDRFGGGLIRSRE